MTSSPTVVEIWTKLQSIALCPFCTIRYLSPIFVPSKGVDTVGDLPELAVIIQSLSSTFSTILKDAISATIPSLFDAFAQHPLLSKYEHQSRCIGCDNFHLHRASAQYLTRFRSELQACAYINIESLSLALSFPSSFIVRDSVVAKFVYGIHSSNIRFADVKDWMKEPFTTCAQLVFAVQAQNSDISTTAIPPKRAFYNTAEFRIQANFEADQRVLEGEYKILSSLLNNSNESGKSCRRKRERKDSLEAFSIAAISTIKDGITSKNAENLVELYNSIKEIQPPSLSVTYSRTPIFLSGYYLKYSRELSQTPWSTTKIKTKSTDQNDEELKEDSVPKESEVVDGSPVDGEEIEFADLEGEEDGGKLQYSIGSVEEDVVKPIRKLLGKVDEYKFHSSGREDADVRMLGNGRPFFLELINSRSGRPSASNLLEMTNLVNKSQYISIHSFAVSSVVQFNEMTKNVELKQKQYRMIIYTERPVTQSLLTEKLVIASPEQPLLVDQRTPIRVLHRRTDAIRKKEVFQITCEYINSHWFQCDLLCSSGMYVKEFVHGDRNRTSPNIGSLLNSHSDIIQLDVMKVME